jgi:hypothetical protein
MLREDDKAPHFIKVNWDKSVDEDKDKCGKYLDVGGMDCFEMGNFDDSDDMVYFFFFFFFGETEQGKSSLN